jgi:hypothetical protein
LQIADELVTREIRTVIFERFQISPWRPCVARHAINQDAPLRPFGAAVLETIDPIFAGA